MPTASSSPSTPSPVMAETETDPGNRVARRARSLPRSRSILLSATTSGMWAAPISSSTLRTASIWPSTSGAEASATCSSRSERVTSSSVDRNASTRSWGSFETKPTVSLIVACRPPGRSIRRVVGSSVAKSWSATITSAPVSRRISVDFPAFV